MLQWNPDPFWKDEDVFIIGGGTSLHDFDWQLLKNEHTIGCNQAFRLGPEVCDICIFCDIKFIFRNGDSPRRDFYDKLSEFPNPVVTNNNVLGKKRISWLKYMPRKVRGLGKTTLGYNKNTGAAAVNLALILGAKNIFLLGFDMFLGDNGNPNWHNNGIESKSQKTVYPPMCSAFSDVKKDLGMFPESKIFNVTEKSNLNTFPKISRKVFWEERINNAKQAG